ncbi:hypothetical protein [Paucibacter soli]|uniref:hypothetical protein n=1 Tax=Paucibacter soli TaxID=3133433 RepID=UPI0030B53CA0
MTADDLDILKSELERDDLQIYSAAAMARRDIETGNVDAALARLRVDADKLRCYDTQINRLLMSH